MKNTLEDLNNHLFAQIERLGDEELTASPEKLEREIARSKAIGGLSKEVISTMTLALDAQKALGDGLIPGSLPPMLENKSGKNGG